MEGYGSAEWLENEFRSSDDDPWGHDWRGAEKYRYKLVLRLIRSYCPKASEEKAEWKILDIGCSTGEFTHLLYQFSKKVVGIDVSQTAINRAKCKFPNIDFKVSRFPGFQHGDIVFDLITCLEVLYYMDKQTQENLLTEMKTMLDIDGKVIITSYIGKKPYFIPEDLIRLVSAYLTIEHVEYYYGRAYYQMEYFFWKRFKQIHKLIRLLSADCQGLEHEVSNPSFWEIRFRILVARNKILRLFIIHLLKIAKIIIKEIVSSEFPARLAHRLGINLVSCRSHIFIVASKSK